MDIRQNLSEGGAKAPEGWRSPRRFANVEHHEFPRQRLGVRRPSAALFAVGDATEGPFGPAGEPISTNWGEGPSAIKIGSEPHICFDHWGNPKYSGASKSTGMKTDQDISATLTFLKGIRHGTVLTVLESVVQQIQNPR
jgi:hypothetical protein